MGEVESTGDKVFLPFLLYKVHDPIRECRQYCGLNIFSLFWWTKSLHHKTGKKKEEFFLVKPILLWVSYYWPMQTVLWPKKLFLFFFFFLIHSYSLAYLQWLSPPWQKIFFFLILCRRQLLMDISAMLYFYFYTNAL